MDRERVAVFVVFALNGAVLGSWAHAQAVAARLLSLLEDGLDAQGGMEELGLCGVAGVALLDPSMSEASALEQAATAAAARAAAMKTPGAATAAVNYYRAAIRRELVRRTPKTVRIECPVLVIWPLMIGGWPCTRPSRMMAI